LALREHVDELRTIRARKEREAGRTPSPGHEFEGVPDLIAAVREFQTRARELDQASAIAVGPDGNPARVSKLNDDLTAIERNFLPGDGLPGRTWFKHAIYAPGLTTGYASWPLPAIRQAIEENKPEDLKAAVAKTSERIRQAAAALKAAAE